MKSFLFRFRLLARLVVQRLMAQRSLALAAAFGLMVSFALILSIPLYADAVYFRLLRESLVGSRVETATPLGFRFRYVGAQNGSLQWEDIQGINGYLDSDAPGGAVADLALPRFSLVRQFKTDIFRLLSPSGESDAGKATWISFASINQPELIKIVAGAMPAPAAHGEPVQVLIHQKTAELNGVQVGQEFLARQSETLIPVRVAGIWQPVDVLAKYWVPPIDELALVPEADFAGTIAARSEKHIFSGIWFLAVDGGGLHAGDIEDLLTRINNLEQKVGAQRSGARMDISPLGALKNYQTGAPELTFLLLAYSVPIAALLLAFIGLVIGLFVNQQRGQIAILRSRGATRAQVTGLAALEGFILCAFALLLALPVGMLIAVMIGQARTFLNFSGSPDLRVGVTTPVLWVGAGAAAAALVALLLPTLRAARHTVLSYRLERARLLRPPWWQRIWLDGLLLIPTAFSFYQLTQQGRLAGDGGRAVTDLFGNPLLFLTPALGLFALTLFLARLLPLVMTGIAWVMARTESVGMLLASRQLSRSPGLFTAPLMLLTLTLSLSTFTASLAQTLDTHLTKQTYYNVGADLRLSEQGLSTGLTGSQPGERWLFRPVENHLTLPGVLGAARVGRFPAVANLSGAPVSANFIGIDPHTFAQVVYWQPDFSPQAFREMMEGLYRQPNGVLVSQNFLDRYGLTVGDPVVIAVNTVDGSANLSLVVVGRFDLFPTWYPEQGELFVGNLSMFFQTAGRAYPYDVWLKTAPGVDQNALVRAVRGMTALLDPNFDPRLADSKGGLNIIVTEWHSAPLNIVGEQTRPQRQGLFGLLSVGFIASAVMTVIGFLLYALFSFRRRFIELGVLRAIGLSTEKMVVLLAWELASLIFIGIAAGTGLGVWVSAWFIPYLQVGVDMSSRFPPFTVEIAWGSILRIYLLFGLLFLVALGGLTALLVRMKIFQAVKLGETV